MSSSVKRLLLAATVALALGVPSAASATMLMRGAAPKIGGQAPQAVPGATVLSPPGFQWLDAGIGAAAVLVLLVAGSGVAFMVRGRAHRPLAG
jgi:hypothetical protein